MANLLTSLFRRRSDEVARFTLSDYVRQRELAIESGFFGYPVATTYNGRTIERVEDSYTGLVSYAYRGDSVVAACMRVRRDLFRQARFCWRELGDTGPGKVFRNDDLALLEQPWPNGTTGELLTRMITDVDLCGNSFILNEGDRLRWLRPDWVSIVLSGDPQHDADIDVVGYVYTPGGTETPGRERKEGVPYQPEQICHWSPEQDPLAFYRGMSWVSKALDEIAGDRAATTHKLAFFRNGATLGPIVRVPAGMTVDQFKEFVAAAEAAHAGAANAYKTMYVGGGAEITLAAADFRQLDLKSVQGGMETRIAAVAGVHPVLVGLSEGLAGSSLNSGNFAAARRATAEMTLFALWQDACGALQAFFEPPKDAELWIRERDIPFLREERRDQAEITKTKILAVEAGMRAGFKPDPMVEAVETDDLSKLVGEHTGLFSVQMQAPQTSQPGVPGLPGAPGAPAGEPAAPIDFGALRSDLWDVDEDDIERAVADMFDEDDDDLERRYNPAQERIPAGFKGGGRFKGLHDQLIAILKDWAKGEGPDDPLKEHGFNRDQLMSVLREMRKRAAADGDNERVARLTPRRGASDDELKLLLYNDVKHNVRAGRDAQTRLPGAPKGHQRFTIDHNGQSVDVGVFKNERTGQLQLYRESDSGVKQGRAIKTFADAGELETWARAQGHHDLAEHAAGAPKAEKAPSPIRKTVDDLFAAPSHKERDDILQKLSHQDLHKVADEAGIKLPEKYSDPGWDDRIRFHISGQVQYLKDTGRAPKPAREVSAPAKKATPRKAVPGAEKPDFSPPPGIQQIREERLRRRLEAGYSAEPTEADARAAIARLTRQQAIQMADELNIRPYGRSVNSMKTDDIKGMIYDDHVGFAIRQPGGHDNRPDAHAQLVDAALEIRPSAPAKKATPKVAAPRIPPADFDAATLEGLPTRQKRARLRAMGFSPEQIDELAPTAAAKGSAEPKLTIAQHTAVKFVDQHGNMAGSPTTLAALEKKGLVKRVDGKVTLTDAGRVALTKAPPADPARIAEQLAAHVSGLDSEAEMVAALRGSSVAQLRRVASEAGIKLPPTLKDRDAIANFIAHTLASYAIKGHQIPAHRSAGFDDEALEDDIERAEDVEDEDLDDEDLDDEESDEDEPVDEMDLALEHYSEDEEVGRAAGHDVTPGHDELHHYWTRGEGLAKWVGSPKPWTTLVAHLTKYVGPEKAKRFASRWFIEVFGFAAGSDMNRVTHGHPPRGHLVGPG